MQWPVSLPNGASAEGKTLMFLASQADHNKTNVSKVLMDKGAKGDKGDKGAYGRILPLDRLQIAIA